MYDLTIYTDEELQTIQKLELECLKAIIKACETLKIEYFLIGGTALGAVSCLLYTSPSPRDTR